MYSGLGWIIMMQVKRIDVSYVSLTVVLYVISVCVYACVIVRAHDYKRAYFSAHVYLFASVYACVTAPYNEAIRGGLPL